MERIQFETSPGFLFLCLLLATGLSYWLYKMPHPWSDNWNKILTGIRGVLLFALMFLLLGPIIKQIARMVEKPVWVLQVDNSLSLAQQTDSVTLEKAINEIKQTQEVLTAKGFEAIIADLDGNITDAPRFNATTTDINHALQQSMSTYEGRKIAGVILLSDGIYTQGNSPLYSNYNFPVFTLGIGDTLQHLDVSINNISYNKITYQGNRFPVQVEVVSKNINPQPVKITLKKGAALLDQKTVVLKANDFQTVAFQGQAVEKGIQKIDVEIETIEGEVNTHNNRASGFIEVVEGKKKILLAASAPHPDVKVLFEVINKNSNYTCLLHIPGVTKRSEQEIQPGNIDLVIFHQIPDLKGRTQALFLQYAKTKVPLFLITGSQTDLRMLSKNNMPISVETLPREFDEVTPIVNNTFSHFTLTPENISSMVSFPPVSVHFGRIMVAPSSTSLLFQQVGSLATQKPLLAVSDQENRKIALLLGEGIWRWRLNEYDRTETTVAFDELFGKLIQYLSTAEDKRKFRSYPIQQEFVDTQPVVMESQVFNDLFEPVYGNSVDIAISDASGKQYRYSYVINAGNSRYQIGGLPEGVYQYRSSATLSNGKREEVKGEFVVVNQEQELQNLTADFDLLRKLAAHTGGTFYHASQHNQLRNALQQQTATSTILTEETFKAMINLKWIFWLLVILFSVEWFARKYWGGY